MNIFIIPIALLGVLLSGSVSFTLGQELKLERTEDAISASGSPKTNYVWKLDGDLGEFKVDTWYMKAAGSWAVFLVDSTMSHRGNKAGANLQNLSFEAICSTIAMVQSTHQGTPVTSVVFDLRMTPEIFLRMSNRMAGYMKGNDEKVRPKSVELKKLCDDALAESPEINDLVKMIEKLGLEVRSVGLNEFVVIQETFRESRWSDLAKRDDQGITRMECGILVKNKLSK